jgi:hypothetical protein
MAGQVNFADYWEAYGFSHRPLISRWLWVADLRWFAGSNGLLLSVSLLMQLLIFCVVRFLLLRDEAFKPHQRCMLLVGVTFCLLNITQVFNFLHTFDVQWFLVTGLVTLSLLCILEASKQNKTVLIAIAWLLIFLASLNNFSALVMWPVAVLLMASIGVSWRAVGVFFIATAIYFVAYFYQLSGTDTNNSSGVFSHLSVSQWLDVSAVMLIKFPLVYLSNPLSFQLSEAGPLKWVGLSGLPPSIVGALLLCAAVQWLRTLKHKQVLPAVAWLGLSLMLFGYGVAVATALGRAIFWDNVYALRYQNIVLLFWIGVILWLAAGVKRRNAGLLLGSLLLLLIFTVNIGWYHDLILKTGNRTRDAHLALVVGLENQLSAIQATVSRSHLGDSHYNLQKEAAFLRNHHTGPYADTAWTDIPLLNTLQTVLACQLQPSDSDVHGSDDSYARLSISFPLPARYDVVAWFDGSDSVTGLLIATREDVWWKRLQQTLLGFREYAGFSKKMPRQIPNAIFARQGDHWCRLSLP